MQNSQKITLTHDQMVGIVGDLQVGYRVFYHVKTHETKSLVDLDSYGYIADEMVDEWNELEANRSDYLEIENMDSGKAFEMMESFLEQVGDIKFRGRLAEALNKRKPFANFKSEIENNGEYRENWFKHRDQKMMEFILDQLTRNLF